MNSKHFKEKVAVFKEEDQTETGIPIGAFSAPEEVARGAWIPLPQAIRICKEKGWELQVY